MAKRQRNNSQAMGGQDGVSLGSSGAAFSPRALSQECLATKLGCSLSSEFCPSHNLSAFLPFLVHCTLEPSVFLLRYVLTPALGRWR